MAVNRLETLAQSNGSKPEDFRMPGREPKNEWDWPQDTAARREIRPLTPNLIDEMLIDENGESYKYVTYLHQNGRPEPEISLDDIHVFLVKNPKDSGVSYAHPHQKNITEVVSYYGQKGLKLVPVDAGDIKPYPFDFCPTTVVTGESGAMTLVRSEKGYVLPIDPDAARDLTASKVKQITEKDLSELNLLVEKPRY